MPLLCLPFIIILLSVFSLLRHRSTRSYQEKLDAFWEKERRANSVRKQDISQLDYITLPLEHFPMGRIADEKLASCEKTLQELSERQILNLSGISNTDLKLQYGAANLTFLSDCDANFTVLARTLLSYGTRLAELGYSKDAITVLEFGVRCRTDVSSNYTLLARLYRENGAPEKIEELTETVKALNSLMKDSILHQLETA